MCNLDLRQFLLRLCDDIYKSPTNCADNNNQISSTLTMIMQPVKPHFPGQRVKEVPGRNQGRLSTAPRIEDNRKISKSHNICDKFLHPIIPATFRRSCHSLSRDHNQHPAELGGDIAARSPHPSQYAHKKPTVHPPAKASKQKLTTLASKSLLQEDN